MSLVAGDLLSAAISKLADLNVRLDSMEAGVNARLDERDRVVLAVAETIDRLTARMDSYETRELTSASSADTEPPGEDYRAGELAEGLTALEDTDILPEAREFMSEPTPEPLPIALEE